MRLTLYILSYNAPDKVSRILDSLLPWESDHAEIIVGDNSDNTAVVELVESRREDFKGRLQCIRHVCNLGYAGNMLRAFEAATSQYVWIVGCGDRFLPDSIAKVESVLAHRGDAMILFPVNGLKARPWPMERVYNDFVEVVKEIELGPLNSINSICYRLDCVRKYLPLAYESVSLIPQTTLIAAMLKDGHHLYFHPQQVFERLPRSARTWDPRRFWMNLSMIYPVPADRIFWNRVRGVILKDWKHWILDIEKEGYPITWPLVLSTWAQFGAGSIGVVLRMALQIVKRKIKLKGVQT